MKIGFMQFAPALCHVETTIRTIDRLIVQCKEADLVVLPELCNSGYHFASREMAWEGSEEIANSLFIRFLESKCKQYGFYMVSGFNERFKNLLFNSAVLIGPEGYMGKYRKLHLFMNEKDYFAPGDAGLPIFDLGLCKIGLLVCFDWIFPEAWRILALKGADIICHPSNLVLPGFAQKAIPIHALLNHVYVVTSNRIGTERDLSFTGLSTIANPKGELLVQASQTAEEVRVKEVDLSLARDKMITRRNHILTDRRPEEYGLLTQNDPFDYAEPIP